MRKVAAILLLLSLAPLMGGCAGLQTAFNVLTGAEVSPKAVIIAANTFNAIEATGKNYLRLTRCTGTNGPICRDPAATAKLIPAIKLARGDRDNLIQFLKDHPGQLGPSGLYAALQQSIGAVQDIFNQYHIGAATGATP